MIIRILISDTTLIPVDSLQVKIHRGPLHGALALLILSTLCGCTSLLGSDNSIIAPPDSVGNPTVNTNSAVFEEPEATPEDSTVASIQSPTGPTIEARCDLNSGLGTTLNTLVDELTKQEIPYTLGNESIGEWRDCSGIFLRFSSALAESCPILESQLAASAGVKKYNPGTDNLVKGVETQGQRSTKTIADWYHSQGAFTPVTYASVHDEKLGATELDIIKLADIRNHIKVGSVLWFSYHKPQMGDDIQSLFSKHINHMGVVTKVITDDNGVLERYEMFHGHGKKNNLAKTTTQHFWEWTSDYTSHEKYPPLGFWGQYLVGIAPVFAGHTDVITLSAN